MSEGGSGFNIHPMDQFRVTPLFGGTEVHWYTPTNATLWMALTVGAVVTRDGFTFADLLLTPPPVPA